MTPVEQTLERVLVLKAQMGERAALEELYRRYSPRLGYYLRRMLQTDDAADAQQELWLAVIRGLPRLRAAGAFAVWIYRVARSKALKQVEMRHECEPLDVAAEQVQTDEDGSNFAPADAAALHQAMSTLPAPQREVLILRFMETLSYEEIAQVIGCTVGTVRSRLHYAKLNMAKKLEKQHE